MELRYRLALELAKLRTDKKATQAELAARLKTTTSVVSRIESGNQNLSVDTVEKIAEALGNTVEFLFKRMLCMICMSLKYEFRTTIERVD